MPQPFTIFHFLPLTHHRGAVPIVEELLTEHHCPILDLEDSVSCIFDLERNDQLKATARKGLLRLADALKDNPLPHEQILVRINQRDSRHYPLDINAIVACHQQGFSPSVLLSKTHCAEDIGQCQNEFVSRLNKAVRVVPIIESQRGLDGLEEIIDAMPLDNRIAIFGYFDYALDVGHWPMLDQTQSRYWELFDRVRDRAEQKQTILINSPYAQWRHEEDLTRIKSILLAAGSLPTGMCSVGMPQTRVLNRPVIPDRQLMIDQAAECPIAKAHAIIEQFETARCNQRSFAVVDGYFVTPHEYQLAKRFLQQQEAQS